MRRPVPHRMTVLAIGGLLAAVLAGWAAAGSSAHGHGACRSARATSAPTGVTPPSRCEQEKVLDAAYGRMRAGRSGLSEARDVVDYGIGSLWSRGIDGAGTTIALAEQWDDPAITKVVARYDRLGHLPNPQITAIYPSGDHKLPSRCPSTAFGDSCSGAANELQLDVITAHLMAPYARWRPRGPRCRAG